eukprot:6688651-Prymnesium_polylepis.2
MARGDAKHSICAGVRRREGPPAGCSGASLRWLDAVGVKKGAPSPTERAVVSPPAAAVMRAVCTSPAGRRQGRRACWGPDMRHERMT